MVDDAPATVGGATRIKLMKTGTMRTGLCSPRRAMSAAPKVRSPKKMAPAIGYGLSRAASVPLTPAAADRATLSLRP